MCRTWCRWASMSLAIRRRAVPAAARGGPSRRPAAAARGGAASRRREPPTRRGEGSRPPEPDSQMGYRTMERAPSKRTSPRRICQKEALRLPQTAARTAPRKGHLRRFDLWAVALVAAHLQAGIVEMGPVAPVVRADLALSNSTLGLITATPPVAMGAAAIPGALLAQRLGPARAVTWTFALLAAGSLLRALAPGAGSLAL